MLFAPRTNYSGFANHVGLPVRTVKDYFEILDDTLLGYMLPPWRDSQSRKSVAKAKHYLFDCGVMHTLSQTKHVNRTSNHYGRSFEHFILNEVRAYNTYSRSRWELCFWRTKHGTEVDIIINDEYAIEVKATQKITQTDTKGLKAIAEAGSWKSRILVSQDLIERNIEDGITILNWQSFLTQLWQGKIS